jgi:hypothetical protein
MPALVQREAIDKVKAALAAVASNGQAVAACAAAVDVAKKLVSVLDAGGGPVRAQAAKDLVEYSRRVEIECKKLDGAGTSPVSAATWAKAKEQIFNLYMLAFTLQSTAVGVDFGDGWTTALNYSVSVLPETVGRAAKVTMAAVNTVVTEAAKVGGSLAWGMVAGAWPLFLVAGVGLVGYLWLKKKIPVIP